MKKRILSILLTLCMVLMLVPTTAFAEGGTTTYDLWQVDGKVYYAQSGTHTDFSTAGSSEQELPDWSNSVCYQFPGSGIYKLQTDITLTSSKQMIQFTTSGITLDLNGKTVTGYYAAISYVLAGDVTLQDSVGGGTINGSIDIGYNVSFTFKSGKIKDVNNRGTFYADGGTIHDARNTGKITQSTGTACTVFTGDVTNDDPISGNISGNISGGIYYGEVTNIATISGGVFYGGIVDDVGTFTKPYHTVSFDLDGGNGTVPATQYFVNIDTAQALEPDIVPTKEDKTFFGWYNGNIKYDFTQNVTENITLKAQWEDIEKPVITGLENGKTYCSAQTVSVSDNDAIKSVTVNGKEVSLDENSQFTLPANGEQTIVVTDKAGNETEMTVTVNDGHTYSEWQSNGNSTHTRYCTVEGCNVPEDGKCSGGEATCTSKAICAYCKEEYGKLDSANHNLEKISAKDATVTATGNTEYWHCKDCSKYFIDKNGKNEIKLDDTVIAKLPPEIIDGKGRIIIVGEKKELTFRSNAAFGDFIRVEFDGKTLDEKNYIVREGSTVVTLKADYVATLSAGEHTIGIVSANGTAATIFTVNAKAVVDNDTKSPQTGDNSHMALLLALFLLSGGLLSVTVFFTRFIQFRSANRRNKNF